MENRSLQYIKTLDVEQIKQAMEQSHPLWGGGVSLEMRTSLLFKRLGSAGSDIFYMSGMVSPSRRLVSSMKRYYFDLSIEQKKIKTLGLGAIFTDPNERGKGHAAKMIQTVLEEASQREGCQAAFLYSDIEPTYYHQFGFKTLPAQKWSLDIKKNISEKTLATREARPSDLDQLLHWYEQGWEAVKMRVLRNKKTWPLFREMNHLEPDRIWVSNNVPVGYCTYGWDETQKNLILAECFVLEEYKELALNSVLALAHQYQADKIQGWQGSEMFITGAVLMQPRKNSVPMIKFFNEKHSISVDESDLYFGIADHF